MTRPNEPRIPTDYFGLAIPFLETIGLVPEQFDGGKSRTRLPLLSAVMNSRGEFQGGALMTALDFTMSAAARSSYAEPMAAATIDMTTTFLSPALSDLSIEATCIRSGRMLAFCDGEIRDAKGELVARATATFRMIPRSAKQ